MLSRRQAGFTLVELLIALAFFSFLLMALTVGFVQINRAFTKGITVKTIQENGRVIIEDISRAIRASGGGSIDNRTAGPTFRLGVNNTCYSWNQSTSVTSPARSAETYLSSTDQINLVRTKGPCPTVNGIAKGDAESMIDSRAVVQHLAVQPIGSQAYAIVLVLSTSNSDDLAAYGTGAKCKERIGNQYCDVVRYETVVSVRN